MASPPRSSPANAVPVVAQRPRYPDGKGMPPPPVEQPLRKRTAGSLCEPSAQGPTLKTSPERRSAFSRQYISTPDVGQALELREPVTIANVKSTTFSINHNSILILSNRSRTHCPAPNADEMFVVDAFFVHRHSTLKQLCDLFAFGDSDNANVQIKLISDCGLHAPLLVCDNPQTTLDDIGFDRIQHIGVRLPYDASPDNKVAQFEIRDILGKYHRGQAPRNLSLAKLMAWAFRNTPKLDNIHLMISESDMPRDYWSYRAANHVELEDVLDTTSCPRIPNMCALVIANLDYHFPTRDRDIDFFSTKDSGYSQDAWFAILPKEWSINANHATSIVQGLLSQAQSEEKTNKCVARRTQLEADAHTTAREGCRVYFPKQ